MCSTLSELFLASRSAKISRYKGKDGRPWNGHRMAHAHRARYSNSGEDIPVPSTEVSTRKSYLVSFLLPNEILISFFSQSWYIILFPIRHFYFFFFCNCFLTRPTCVLPTPVSSQVSLLYNLHFAIIPREYTVLTI